MVFFCHQPTKSPCDGVGGTVKCKLTNTSFTAPVDSPILSSQATYDYCSTYISEITFFLSSADIEVSCQMLKNRYSKGKTAQDTRGYHCFCPVSSTTIAFTHLSNDSKYTGTHSFYDRSIATYHFTDLHFSSYVACVYEHNWWVGQIIQQDDQNEDVEVRLMHPKEPATSIFFWPTCDDKCWVPLPHVLLKLTVPTTRNGRMYEFSGDEINNLKLMKLPLP